MNIRPAFPDDLPDIRRMHIANWRLNYQEILPAPFLAQGIIREMSQKWDEARLLRDQILVASDSAGIAGFVATECQGTVAYLDNLHVHKKRQGQGIGRLLVVAALRAVRSKYGANRLWLKVIVGNDAALEFYRRLGGTVSESFEEALMGVEISSQRVSWDDLDMLLRQLAPK